MESTRVPDILDPVRHFLLWDAESACIASTVLFISFNFGQVVPGIVLAVAAMVFWSRATATKPRGWIAQRLYWLGLFPALRRTPHSALRRFLG